MTRSFFLRRYLKQIKKMLYKYLEDICCLQFKDKNIYLTEKDMNWWFCEWRNQSWKFLFHCLQGKDITI